MKQKGFTLIELVIVIVILGILAATALPKFIDLSTDARRAALRAVDGSMRAANTLIYARAAIDGRAANENQSVSINGQNVVTDWGFAGDIGQLLGMMDIGPDFTSANTTSETAGVIQFTRATTPANCSVTYAHATGAGRSPTYTLVDTGC